MIAKQLALIDKSQIGSTIAFHHGNLIFSDTKHHLIACIYICLRIKNLVHGSLKIQQIYSLFRISDTIIFHYIVIVDFIIKEEARECLEMIETIHYSIVGLNTLSGESFKNNILYHLDKITYEELRKAYFILKAHGYYVPKEIPNTFKTIDIQDLNIVDNYLSNVITTLNQADEETASKIIEELASYDLEYLKENLPHNQKPVIDGLIETENTPNIKEIIRYLEMVNNLSIEEQAKSIEYIKPKKIKKIKKDPGNKQWA